MDLGISLEDFFSERLIKRLKHRQGSVLQLDRSHGPSVTIIKVDKNYFVSELRFNS